MNALLLKKIAGGLFVSVPMALFAFGDVSASSFVNAAFAGYGHDKVLVCHNGKTLEVSASAVAGHLRHGDTLGKCKKDDHHGDDNHGGDNHGDNNGGHENDGHNGDNNSGHGDHDNGYKDGHDNGYNDGRDDRGDHRNDRDRRDGRSDEYNTGYGEGYGKGFDEGRDARSHNR